MKRLAALITLALGTFGFASAVPHLYTMTVKTSPAKPDTLILVYNAVESLSDKYSCMNQGAVMTCRLPAGEYRIGIYANKKASYSLVSTAINFTKNQVFTYKIKATPIAADMPEAKQQPFIDLLIKITGTRQPCNSDGFPTTIAKLCATTHMNMELVKQWVGLVDSLHQSTAWDSAAGIDYAQFTVGSDQYVLALSETDDGGAFLQWTN
jgi:hypothetical protein